MNTSELARPLKGAVAVFFSLLAGIVSAETVTVDSVAELVSNLDRLNRDRNTAHTIILAEGSYDVSACAMDADTGSAFEASKSHLCVSHLTLKGATANPRDTVIYGNGSNRIFFCNAGTIESLTVSNGYHATENGAGVLARHQKATTLTNVVVTCCSATAGDGGGAYFVTYARDCRFTGNRSNYGGAIAQTMMTTFPDSGVYGGVICGNEAVKSGGGAMNANLYGVEVFCNRANLHGGGVFINGGQSVHGGSIVSNSTVKCGGGAYMSTSSGSSVMDGTLVACNSAGEGGGGVSAYQNELVGCVISNNVCAGVHEAQWDVCGGGGVFYGRLRGCIVIGNSVTNNTSSNTQKRHMRGGGVLSCSFVTNCTIIGNSTVYAGGGASDSTLVGCTVSNNLAHCLGGGVYASRISGGNLVFNMVENIAGFTKEGLGAAAYASFVTNALVAGNAAVNTARTAETWGGAGYNSVFSSCEIKDNYASAGGAMYGGRADKSSFKNNAAKSVVLFRNTEGFVDCDIQGAVLDWPGYLVNCKVHGYDFDGYAVIQEGANVYTSGVFKSATVSGTSPVLLRTVVNAGSSGIAATNTIFYNNRVTGLFWPSGVHVSFVNCQFINNCAQFTCTGLGVDSGSSCELVNTIFSGNRNRAGSAAVEYYPDWSGDTNVVARNCIFGTGARRAMPRVMENCRENIAITFKGDEKWPYQPSRLSAAAGNGLVQDWMANATDIRGEGYPRLNGGKADIGAYQYHRRATGLELFVK